MTFTAQDSAPFCSHFGETVTDFTAIFICMFEDFIYETYDSHLPLQ